MINKKRPEILSPVGSMEAFYAAINSGADAIYLAGELYGARKATVKFNMDDIKFIISTAHLYGVKVYITINTLIFDNEINDCIKYTDEIYKLGVDAVLIQDMGLINIFSKRYKDLDLHISTQANVKCLEEIMFFERIPQIKRVVLARETSIDEVRRIKENTNLEIEIFVHGAICMSYSGNCLFSSLTFDRSGNRGECAQPCRLKYSLYENNKLIDDNKYLLSPKELNTILYIDELIDLGVDSFKIEGRIKNPEYVALTTSLYKEKVMNKNKLITDLEIEKLKRAYNRDFTKGYLFNITPNTLVNSFRPNNMGVYLGKIIDNNKLLKIKLESRLNRLDGIRIIANTKDDYGLVVDKIYKENKEVEFALPNETVFIESYKMPKFDCSNLDCYVTSSVSLKEEFKDQTINKINRHDKPLNLKIELKTGEYPILLETSLNKKVIGDFKVLEASNKPIDKDIIYNQLNKLNDTPYYINKIEYDIDNNSFIPLGVLNNLRRSLIESLQEKIKEREITKGITFNKAITKKYPQLIVKVERVEQFKKSYEIGVRDFIVLGFDLYNYLKSTYLDCNILLETPRIVDDYNKYKSIDNLVVNDVGSISDSSIIDSYLNVTNVYSMNFYYEMGAKLITLSHEISKDLIIGIKDRYRRIFNHDASIAFTIYDKTDLMIMKYCLIAGKYQTKPNCKICKNNSYKLKDRNDNYMDIIPTETCGNRLLNSKTLCLFEYLDDIKKNVDTLRINFTNENELEVEKVLKAYFNNSFIDGLDFTRERFLK